MYILLVWCSVLSAVLGSQILLGADGGAGLYSHYGGEYAATYDNYQPHDYQFDYAVSDPHTGDHKAQWEVKEHGVVRGGYSLLEPDGTTRIVEYIADDHGFRAVVKKLGTSIHPSSVETHGFSGGHAVVQAASQVSVAAPVAVVKPIAVAAPVASSISVATPSVTLSSPVSVSSHAQDISYVQTQPQIEFSSGYGQNYAAAQGVPQLHTAQRISLLQEAPEVSLEGHVQQISSVQSLPAQEVHNAVQSAPQLSAESHSQHISTVQAAPAANIHIEQAQQPILSQAAFAQYAEKEPLTYSSYDGSVNNYANVLSAATQHLKPISYSQPIEIPHSVELHGYRNAAPAGDYYQAQNLVAQASPANILTSQHQPGYSYHIPHSSPIYTNEISVPKAAGLANVNLGSVPWKGASIVSGGYLESASLKAAPPCESNQVPLYQSAVPQHAAISQVPQWWPQQSLAASSQIHGLTGNLQDDYQYTSYGDQSGNFHQLGNGYLGAEAYAQPSPSYLAKRNVKPLVSYVVSHPTPK